MSAIAIIPARGGSKRIPRKNIRSFVGFPIIKYSIDAALRTQRFKEIMVSTDDEEIAAIATRFGAHVPFLRSAASSTDFAGTAEVLLEVLNAYLKEDMHFSHLCCIYPTAPFITQERIKTAMDMLIENDVDAVIPIVQYSFPIQRSVVIENGFVKMQWPENVNVRSQDFAPVYHDCGQFYCLKTESFRQQNTLWCERTIPLIIAESEVQDIDTEENWKIAEIKYKIIHHNDALDQL